MFRGVVASWSWVEVVAVVVGEGEEVCFSARSVSSLLLSSWSWLKACCCSVRMWCLALSWSERSLMMARCWVLSVVSV